MNGTHRILARSAALTLLLGLGGCQEEDGADGPTGVESRFALTGDTTPPVVTIISPADGAVITGAGVIWRARATDDVAIKSVSFYIDFGPPFYTTALAGPDYSTALPPLTNGLHVLMVIAYDAAGNRSNAAAVEITVQGSTQAPPNMTITSPAAGSTLVGIVTYSADIVTTYTIVNVAFQAYSVNAGSFNAVDYSAPYSVPFNTTSVKNGVYYLKTKAYDANVNTRGWSGLARVTIDNPPDFTAPVCSITSPAGGAVVRFNADVAIAATDNASVLRVGLHVDGGLVGTDSAAPFSFKWNTASVPDGLHTLTAKAYDGAGNVGVSSPVTVMADNTPPTVPTGLSAVASSSSSIALSWNPSSDGAGSGVLDYTVQQSMDGVTFSSGWAATATSRTMGFLNGGTTYYFRVRAHDRANFYSAFSAVVSATTLSSGGDTTAPVCSITNSPATYTTAQTVTISASASDNVGVARVEFLRNGALMGSDTSSPYSFAWAITSAQNGSHSWTARAFDAAGNSTTSSAVTLAVNITVVDTTAPACSITNSPTTYTTAQTVTISASASDSVGVTRVEFLRNGTLVGSDTTSPYSFAWAISSAQNGSHSWTARAFDAAGNSTLSAAVILNVSIAASTDTTPPAAPTGLQVSRTRVKGSFVDSLSWNASTEGDLAGYRLYRATSSSGPYTLVGTLGRTQTSTQLGVGKKPPTYFYVLRAVDSSGNEGAASNQVSTS